MDKDKNLFWIDTETTGLDLDKDVLVEVGCLVTDKDLNILAEGPDLVIYQDDQVLGNMLEVVKDMHTKSGLYDQIKKSKTSLDVAEDKIMEFIKEYCGFKTSPYCGNTVGFDKFVLKKQMPRVYGYLHYRTIDVSSVKELAKRWYPNLPLFEKKDGHRAMDDVKASVEELKYYRTRIFRE